VCGQMPYTGLPFFYSLPGWQREGKIGTKNKNNIVGVALLGLGLLLSAGTALLFPVCGPTENGAWMKCHWSSQAVIGVGAVLVVLAVAYLLLTPRLIRAGISLAAVPIGLLAAAIPNGLIGLCANAEMQCRTITQPTVTILSIASAILGAANAFWLLSAEYKGKASDQ
jgi:hypothetical protein